jgi:HNH endonuclease
VQYELDRDALRTAIAMAQCPQCGHVGALVTLEHNGPHYARLTCLSCGEWIDWLTWPPERAAERRRRRQRITQLGEDRCELCLRTRDQLPPPERLEEHHVIEHEAGGGDDPDNTRTYCAACHSIVTWLRTYFGHYHAAA